MNNLTATYTIPEQVSQLCFDLGVSERISVGPCPPRGQAAPWNGLGMESLCRQVGGALSQGRHQERISVGPPRGQAAPWNGLGTKLKKFIMILESLHITVLLAVWTEPVRYSFCLAAA